MDISVFFKEFKNIEIDSINIDSKEKKPNSIFVCIEGSKYDSHNFVNEAILNGCCFVVSEKTLNCSVPYIKVNNTKNELARLSSIFYNNPSSKLNIIGVTGTDGKTTVSTILSNLINNTGYIGTNGIDYNSEHYTTNNTTPDSLVINAFLSDMFNNNIKNVAMEVSSKSIIDSRIDYIPFQIAIFTNLTHEHLDNHYTMENYFKTKAKLFTSLDKNSLAIINIDDQYGKELVKMTKAKVITYGIDNKANLRATNISYDIKGSTFDLIYKYRTFKNIHTNLIGNYNVYNILACIAVFFDFHMPFKEIRRKLLQVPNISGRMEIIKSDTFQPIIDFAHTPNSLYQLLSTLKPLCKGNIITVLGAAGNKDKSKRGLMGKVATLLSDFVIFTEEDSYTENLSLIIDDLTSQLETENYMIIESRKNAIKMASKIANNDDFILITGKGNEKTMSKNNTVINYNDIIEIQKYL